jgi:D-alanyl-D-alanine carboxypeptidase/D-alanyl-D-alanine-endopeptidase (penicillin-binding protein 4)
MYIEVELVKPESSASRKASIFCAALLLLNLLTLDLHAEARRVNVAALSGSQGLSKDSGFCAIGAVSGESYGAYRGAEPVIPASVQKLFVTGVALERLGPQYAAETEIFLPEAGRLGAGGVADSLYVRAGLDPGLTTERVFLLARMIRSAGVRRVRELKLDDSALDDPILVKGTRAFLSGVSAFGLNWNSFTVRGCAPRQGSAAPIVSVDPFEFQQRIKSAVRLGKSSSIAAADGAGDGVVVSGTVERGECAEEYVAAADPRRYTAQVFQGLLAAAGIQVERVKWERVPKGAVSLLNFPSRPIEELLREMNYFSNNNMAEMFAGLVGSEPGADGSPQFSRRRGLELIRDEIAESARALGESISGWSISDASGLSTENRVPAGLVCGLLLREYSSADRRDNFFSSLPQFGFSGTVKRRAAGVSGRAKTGSLSTVSSLAGIVYGKREPILFAIIQNGVGDLVRAKSVEDALVRRLGEL